ncbi:AA_kinase domain-containing protein [Cephalotus follicularis]|uniref:acetylglutamate kinase n=1 Tax=Cephalotus follicularis TaxID=3775 RepID=A0A1Q3AN70_CEPFO|nr:AA_kinase domain-containing protein [Cephalotus follicularis]
MAASAKAMSISMSTMKLNVHYTYTPTPTKSNSKSQNQIQFQNHKSKYKKPNFAIKASSSSSVPTPSSSSDSGSYRVDILSEALPFIQRFRGKTIVVKYGGAAMKRKLKPPAGEDEGEEEEEERLKASVIKDLVLLSCVGIRTVLVHGGGPVINDVLKQLHIEPIFHHGLRVTDATTMEVVSMVLCGKVNKDLVSLLNKAGAVAVGLSGMDGRLVTARPSPNSARLGFVGEVAHVDPTVIRPLIDNGHIPVIASVAADESGQPYNINADTVAGELAASLGAEKLILLTDVAGILEDREDPNSLVKEIDIKGVKKMILDGKVGGGMIPKVNCCVRSLAQGVRTASIIDGRVPHSLLHEIMTDQGAGTMISG